MAKWRDSLRGHRSSLSIWWADLDIMVRRVTLGLLFTGALLVEIGFFVDLAGAWQRYPFLVNIVSGMASACFGIPLALAVLSHLLRRQEDYSATLKRRRSAAAAAKQLSGAVALYWAEQHALKKAEERLLEASACLMGNRNLGSVRFADGSTIADLAEADVSRARGKMLYQLLPMLREAHYFYLAGVPSAWTDIEAEIHSTWRYLNDHIRPQLIEAGLPWIPANWLIYTKSEPWQPFRLSRSSDLDTFFLASTNHTPLDGHWVSVRGGDNPGLFSLICDDTDTKLQSINDLRKLTAFAAAVEEALNANTSLKSTRG